jgi:fluoride ion exporter CrcB/FEX
MGQSKFTSLLIGGFSGSAIWELLSLSIPGASGIFLANISGSFILGFLMYGTELGFFSDRELEKKEFRVFAANIILSLFLCGAEVVLGKCMQRYLALILKELQLSHRNR